MTGWKLFLDDDADGSRQPAISVESEEWRANRMLWPVPPNTQHLGYWKIARSYDEAIALLDDFGLPNFVSFDHDLCDETPGKDGLAVAKEIVARDMKYNTLPPDFAYEVHSWNPVGSKNISGFLDSYLAQRVFSDDHRRAENREEEPVFLSDAEVYDILFGSLN